MSSHKRQRRNEDVKNVPKPNNGINLNNIDLNSIAGLINRIDVNEISNYINKISENNSQINSQLEDKDVEENIEQPERDEAALRKDEIVKALQTLINADKAEIVQTAIQLYAASRTVKK